MVINTGKKYRIGVYEWVFQRVTNLLVVVYGLIMANYFLSESAADYSTATAFFSQGWVILFSALMLILICLNSVLAGWQIAGDYLNKNAELNKLFMRVCTVVTVIYLVTGLFILG